LLAPISVIPREDHVWAALAVVLTAFDCVLVEAVLACVIDGHKPALLEDAVASSAAIPIGPSPVRVHED